MTSAVEGDVTDWLARPLPQWVLTCVTSSKTGTARSENDNTKGIVERLRKGMGEEYGGVGNE